MLHAMKVLKRFWAGALIVSVHVHNRVTTRGLKDFKTPYEMIFDKKSDVSHLQVFGCRSWYENRDRKESTLDVRAFEAILIGYARSCHAYKL